MLCQETKGLGVPVSGRTLLFFLLFGSTRSISLLSKLLARANVALVNPQRGKPTTHDSRWLYCCKKIIFLSSIQTLRHPTVKKKPKSSDDREDSLGSPVEVAYRPHGEATFHIRCQTQGLLIFDGCRSQWWTWSEAPRTPGADGPGGPEKLTSAAPFGC